MNREMLLAILLPSLVLAGCVQQTESKTPAPNPSLGATASPTPAYYGSGGEGSANYSEEEALAQAVDEAEAMDGDPRLEEQDLEA